ncbi:MAG: DinB family protein [Bacteroidetes bacterium]|nr:DinB family protein [Bacteroidota bacterium]
MQDFLNSRKEFISEIYKIFSKLDEELVRMKPDKGWSPKEIIGHLIDSASNNHQRFIRAQFTRELIFEGYDQDEWVKVHNYQNADWQLLLSLWRDYNLLLIHALEHIPKEMLSIERIKHNCDMIAFNTVHKDVSVTLEYFIEDYFKHLKHHINQFRKLMGF